MKRQSSFWMVLILTLNTAHLWAESPQEIRVRAHAQGDVWTGVNVEGKVYLEVRTKDGKNRAKFWWIKALGVVEQLGDQGPSISFDIPTAYGKLRVQTSDSDTILYVSEKAQVDSKLKFKW